MSGVEVIEVKSQDDGMRLNRWFLKYYPHLPLGQLHKLLRTKQIKLDGKKCEISSKLTAGQQIRIPPLREEMETIRVENKDNFEYIKSLVIYKDENIIVLNKPSGIAVQGGTNIGRHIDEMLAGLCFEKEEAPRLVHRIDKDTSGILVLARDRKNAEILTKAFRDKDINKTYLAIVRGCPKKEQMLIKANLLKQGEKMVVDAEGQAAISEMKLLDEAGEKFALVELSPKTGRTHQLRVHMQYVGLPILGDDKYFGEKRFKMQEIANKLYLHAYRIDLSNIYKNLVITADLPDYFRDALEFLGLNVK